MTNAMTMTKNVAGDTESKHTCLLLVLRSSLSYPRNLEAHAVVTDHSHFFAALDGAVRFSAPMLAVHENSARRRELGARFADLADETFLAESRFGLLRAKNQITNRQNEAADRRHGGKDDRAIDTRIRNRRIEEQKRAEGKGNNPADAQHAKTRKKCFADQQRQAEQQQARARCD